MAQTFRLVIVTPDRQVVKEEVEELEVPAKKGHLGILPEHAPLLATLTAGEVRYRMGQQTRYLAVSGGFIEVLPDKTTLLVETAEAPNEIDVDRAKAAQEQGQQVLATFMKKSDSAGSEDAEFKKAEARVRRAVVRLQVARRGGSPAS